MPAADFTRVAGIFLMRNPLKRKRLAVNTEGHPTFHSRFSAASTFNNSV
jgi:hypothetical protein